MLIFLWLWSVATASAVGFEKCEKLFELPDDRGTEFLGRIARAATDFMTEPVDPRVPAILHSNVTEVRHERDGAGVALVELQTTFGRDRRPMIVRVKFTRNRVTGFSLNDHLSTAGSADGAFDENKAMNAAMSRVLATTAKPIKDLTATPLDVEGCPENSCEIKVSGRIGHRNYDWFFLVLTDPNGEVRVDESGRHRFHPSVIKAKFKDLLLGHRNDSTLKISSIHRLSLRRWRIVYTLGEVERVDESEEPRSRSDQPPLGTPIRPTGLVGRVVYRGPGLDLRSEILEVDDNYQFRLIHDRMR